MKQNTNTNPKKLNTCPWYKHNMLQNTRTQTEHLHQ